MKILKNGWKYKGNCFRGEKETPFVNWLNTFLDEKGIDLSEEFESEKNGIKMTFSYQDVVDNIKIAPEQEQDGGINSIKGMLVRIDMANGDVKDYLRHLSTALIPEKDYIEEMEDIYGESINLTKTNDLEQEESEEEESI